MFCACSFPGRQDQVSQVRELVARQLGDSPASDDAVLLASELAANACAHSASGEPGGQFVVRLRGGGSNRGQVYVEVEDQGSGWDGLLQQTESPHGLYLLRSLAGACGTRRGARGWITWFVVGEVGDGVVDTPCLDEGFPGAGRVSMKS
jgi:anti-sigma regulatory factor (Ser/Thr protein kinase)